MEIQCASHIIFANNSVDCLNAIDGIESTEDRILEGVTCFEISLSIYSIYLSTHLQLLSLDSEL